MHSIYTIFSCIYETQKVHQEFSLINEVSIQQVLELCDFDEQT